MIKEVKVGIITIAYIVLPCDRFHGHLNFNDSDIFFEKFVAKTFIEIEIWSVLDNLYVQKIIFIS